MTHAPRNLVFSLSTLVLTSVLPSETQSEQIRFDSAADWRQWSLPLGAVELDRGVIRTVELRRGTNAVESIGDYGGGIRAAGSNAATARLAIDGNQATGWEPDWERPVDDWFIEIDLGRGVSANSVELVFDDEAPAFELFDLLLSTGEPATNFIAAPIPGSLVYRINERFKGNKDDVVTLTLEDPDRQPIQFIRVNFLLPAEGARLVDVVVNDFGDNIAVDLLSRGGGLDVAVGINSKNTETAPLGNARALADGDLYTRWRHGTAGRGSADIDAHMILDLGATYNVDLVRVVGGIVHRSVFGGAITTRHYVSRRQASHL